MALLPVTLRRRLRESGFSEEQTDALDEAGEATAESAREGLATETGVQGEFQALRADIAMLRAEMHAMKWWLFGTLSLTILAATAAIIAAIAVWG